MKAKDNPQMTCGLCDGKGKCEFPGEKAFDCPRCEGTGKVEQPWPREVHGIKQFPGECHYRPKGFFGSTSCGDWVAVRPCDEALKGKTFLGVYLGEFPLSVICGFDKADSKIAVGLGQLNPAIFVPDLNRVIYGCESWWGKINSPDDLKQITNQDIENIWYVRALKALSGQEEAKN